MDKIYIFDEVGSRYEVTNMTEMLEQLPDDGLEGIYKSTRYYHHYNKGFLELIEHGLIEQVEGEEYDVAGVDRGLEAFADKITEKMGDEVLNTFIEETDAQWEANKPPDLKRLALEKSDEEE